MLKVKELEEWLPAIQEAYNEFISSQFDDEPQNIESIEILGVVYSEEHNDCEEIYSYTITCELDLVNKLDIYEIDNGVLRLKLALPCEYEDMVRYLEVNFDDWLYSDNDINIDKASELTKKYEKGIDITEDIEKLSELNIFVEIA